MNASAQPVLRENISLKALNTLGLDVSARYFSEATTTQDVLSLAQQARELSIPLVPLGEGSNVVLSQSVDALVMPVRLMGKSCLEALPGGDVIIEAAAGESWHPFVRWTLSQGWFGLENLSLIPGTVGAAPIQNIGAYGVEIKDHFHSLEALNLTTGEIVIFDKNDCTFGYRDSVFKGEGKDRYVILSVRFRLNTTLNPCLSYGGLQQLLVDRCQGIEPSGQDISDAVVAIRQEKLPDPAVLGNAGSFFKNPVINTIKAQVLKASFPNLVMFPVSEAETKLAAGWLIDHCGFKGYQYQGAAVYSKQALVLVNEGNATSKAVLELADEIKNKVADVFGVMLEIEPRVY